VNTDSEERLMIAELERIIRAEEAKPEAERDHTLIDDCIKEIAEIKGVKAEFSEEEVAKITEKLIQTAEKTKKRKRFVRLVAGIAAMFVIVTGVTACAVNPALIDWIAKIVRMPFGTSVEKDTITYFFQGTSEEYNSIDDFLENKNLDVYYPAVIPTDVKLNGIEMLVDNGMSLLNFMFTSTDFHFIIQFGALNMKWNDDVVSEINVNNLHFDVYNKFGDYIAYSEITGNTYIIQSKNIDDIILVVGSLRKGE